MLCLLVFFTTTLMAQQTKKLNALYNTALRFERMRVYDQAIIQFEKLFKANPKNSAYYQGLKRNLLRLEKYELFLQTVKYKLAVQDDVMGNADLGFAFYKLGRQDDAKRQWDLAIKKYAGNASIYIHVANILLREGLVDQAVKIYMLGRKNNKDETLFAVELANIYANRDQRAQATKEFLTYYTRNKRQILWVEGQILSYINSEDSLAVLDEIQKFVKKQKAPDIPLLLLYANSLKSLNKSDEAIEVVLQIEKTTTGRGRKDRAGHYFNQFAAEAYRQEKYEIALKAYAILLQRWPESPYANDATLKTAYIQKNKQNYRQALSILDGYIKTNKNKFEAEFLKGKILAENLREPKEAVAVLTPLFNTSRARDYQRITAYALGDCYMQMAMLDEAERWYIQALQKTEPHNVGQQNVVYFRLAEVKFMNRQFTRTLNTLGKIKARRTPKVGSEDLHNDALEFSFLIEDNLPDSAGALASYAAFKKEIAQYNSENAADTLKSLLAHFPRAALAPIALINLANLYKAEGKMKESEETLRQFLTAYADSRYTDEVLFELADHVASTGKKEEALSYLNEILVSHPYSTYLEETRQKIRALSSSIQ